MSLASGEASRPVKPVHPDLSQTTGARPQKPEAAATSAAASAARATSQWAIAAVAARATASLRTASSRTASSVRGSVAIGGTSPSEAASRPRAWMSSDARATMAAPGRRNPARHRRIRITEDLVLSEAPARERRPWRTVGASARREVRAVTVVIVAMIRAFGSVGWASTECEAEWEGGADDGSSKFSRGRRGESSWLRSRQDTIFIRTDNHG